MAAASEGSQGQGRRRGGGTSCRCCRLRVSCNPAASCQPITDERWIRDSFTMSNGTGAGLGCTLCAASATAHIQNCLGSAIFGCAHEGTPCEVLPLGAGCTVKRCSEARCWQLHCTSWWMLDLAASVASCYTRGEHCRQLRRARMSYAEGRSLGCALQQISRRLRFCMMGFLCGGSTAGCGTCSPSVVFLQSIAAYWIPELCWYADTRGFRVDWMARDAKSSACLPATHLQARCKGGILTVYGSLQGLNQVDCSECLGPRCLPLGLRAV